MGYQGMPAALLDLSRLVRELEDSDAAILLLIFSTALGAEWTVRWSGGGRRGTAVSSSPALIMQAEKTKFFFSEPTPSTLNGHLILVMRMG